jgi:non-canonical poly(A) RNA polymerase PAPD5/7
MLSLRDPADETNDLGRKALCIKHVQATFAKLGADLARDVQINTRGSLLAELVGPSYLLHKERRRKLRQFGYGVLEQSKTDLAEKARMVRERRNAEEAERQTGDFATEVHEVQKGSV